MKFKMYDGKLENYELISGRIIKIRASFLKRNISIIRLDDGVKAISLVVGRQSSVSMSPGQVWTFGHIGRQIINLRPGIRVENNPDDIECNQT